MVSLYSRDEIGKIRSGCKILRRVFKRIGPMVVPGVRTMELNDEVAKLLKDEGATPAFLGYRGFPAACCISVDEEVVHGIPGKRKLKEGDIVSLDIGIFKEGFFGDAAVTFPVGKIDASKKKLLAVTEKALYNGIEAAKSGNTIADISAEIEDTVLMDDCAPVRDLVGHGIGRQLHEDPQVPNYRASGSSCRIREGMVLAIEPMINLGAWEVETLSDQWTVVTKDRRPSAHFEHTVAIVDGRAEILSVE